MAFRLIYTFMAKIRKLFKNYWFNLFLMLSLSALAVFITLKDDDGTTFRVFQNLNWYWLLILGLYVLFYHGIVGWLLYRLTQSKYPHYTFSQGLLNAYIATFFHTITPSASGGQFMQMYVYRKQEVSMSDAASILWLDLIIYQATLISVVALLLLSKLKFIITHNFSLFVLVLVGFVLNGSLILGMWMITRFSRIYQWLITTGVNWGYRFKMVKDKEATQNKIMSTVARFEKGLDSLKHQWHLIFKVALANALKILLAYALPFLVALALKIETNFSDLWLIMVLTACVNMASTIFIVPGASGGIELMFLAMFSAIFRVSQSRGLMLLWRFYSYYFIMLATGLIFLVFKHYYLYKEKQNHGVSS